MIILTLKKFSISALDSEKRPILSVILSYGFKISKIAITTPARIIVSAQTRVIA